MRERAQINRDRCLDWGVVDQHGGRGQQGHQPIEPGDDTGRVGRMPFPFRTDGHRSKRTAVRSTPVAGLPKIGRVHHAAPTGRSLRLNIVWVDYAAF